MSGQGYSGFEMAVSLDPKPAGAAHGLHLTEPDSPQFEVAEAEVTLIEDNIFMLRVTRLSGAIEKTGSKMLPLNLRGVALHPRLKVWRNAGRTISSAGCRQREIFP